MSEPTVSSPSLSRHTRAWMAAAGILLFALLVTAGRLEPHPDGIGTHQQLGLPPCTIQSLFGIRCPSCGMTTSWSHFVRGDWAAASKTNAGGTLLAFSAAAGAVWLGASAARGNWIFVQPNDWAVLGFCISILLVTLTQWLIRVAPESWR